MSLTDKVDALFAEWDRTDSPGCVLSVIQAGVPVYTRAYGMADLERQVPLVPESAFDLGSVGKQFTAMLIALLAEAGHLTLDDSIHQHLSMLPAYGHPVTLRHLIHHTSGLTDYLALMLLTNRPFENRYLADEVLALVARQPELDFVPGEKYVYSNTGYFLLGLIAEHVMQQPFLTLLREWILTPLGMEKTTFNEDFQRIIPQRALAYAPDDQGSYLNDISFCGGFGDGPLFSTVGDLLRWDQNFYHNQLGKGQPGLIDQVLARGTLNNGTTLDYAFGLVHGEQRGLPTVSHGGAWAGYRSELLRFPAQQLSVICLANLASFDPSTKALEVAELYLADQLPPAQTTAIPTPQPAAPVELAPVADLVGFYRGLTYGALIEIGQAEGHYTITLYEQALPLHAISPTQLQTEPPYTLTLTLQPDQQLSLEVHGERENFIRLPAVSIPPGDWTSYTGHYQAATLDIVYTILQQGDQLWLQRGYAAPQSLRLFSADYAKAGRLALHMQRDAANQISGFDLLIRQSKPFRFTRLAEA